MAADSPDVAGYVDLTLDDIDAQTIAERALANAALDFPDWEPHEGNTEVTLIESLGMEVDELVFRLNRLPGAIVEVVLRLSGLERDPGAPAATSLTFLVSDATGHTIPAGTRAALEVGEGLDALELLTDTELVIAPGLTTGTVTATADGDPTTDGAGTPAGTEVELVDAIPYVDSVVLGAPIAGARDPEDGAAFLDRGAARLARQVDTLVTPTHFQLAALEQAYVQRAAVVDRYTPDTIPTPAGVTATPSATGGTLAAGTRSYRVAAINAVGSTLASSAVTAVTTGTTASVTVGWAAVTVPRGVAPVTGYRVYGRTAGAELLIATTAAGATTYLDTGSVTPAGALPVANTTGPAVGTANGEVTVVAAGPLGAPLSPADKTALVTALQAQAVAMLGVHVADPTITAVDVDVTFTLTAGSVAATVQAAVLAALDAYLSPDAWPFAGTVYRNELIALVDKVPGVDRVVTLTINGGTADVVLAGVGPLADLAAGSSAVAV